MRLKILSWAASISLAVGNAGVVEISGVVRFAEFAEFAEFAVGEAMVFWGTLWFGFLLLGNFKKNEVFLWLAVNINNYYYCS